MLNAGAVVQLKSGGPTMTVIGEEGNVVVCAWFDSQLMLQTGSFPHLALKRVPASGKR